MERYLTLLFVFGLERTWCKTVDVNFVRDIKCIIGGGGDARWEALELGRRVLDWAHHAGTQCLDLLAEGCENIRRFAAFEGKVGRVNEGLAVYKLNRYTAAPKLFNNGILNVDLWIGHLLLQPNTFYVGSLGLKGLYEVRDDIFWDTKANEQVRADGSEAGAHIIDGFRDETGSEAAGLPEAVLFGTRLGTFPLITGQTAEFHLSLIKDEDGEEVVSSGAQKCLVFELAKIYCLFCGRDDGFVSLMSIVEKRVVVNAQVETKQADEYAAT